MPVLWTRWNAHTTGWQTRFLLNGISSGNVAVAKCFHFSCYENALVHRLCSPHPPKVLLLPFQSSKWVLLSLFIQAPPSPVEICSGYAQAGKVERCQLLCWEICRCAGPFFFFLIKQLLFFLLLAQRLDSYWQMMQLQKGLSLTYTWMFKVANVTCLNTKLWSS